VIVVVTVILFSIYFMIDGVPWKKYAFGKRAEIYVRDAYPNEEIINLENWYSYVKMDYYTTFYTKSGREIVVSLDKNKQLQSYMNEKVNP
jgi:hypothetical protein